MFQLKSETALSELAARWAAGDPAPELVDATREALGGIRPDEQAAVGDLVRAILTRLAGPGRDGARRAVLTLLDTVRRRVFTRQLLPAQIDPWLGILLPALAR